MGVAEGLNAAAEAALGKVESGTEGAAPAAPSTPPVAPDPAASAATPAPSGNDAFIQELKGKVDRGELNPNDLAFINSKLQSAFGRQNARLSTFEKNAQAVVKALEPTGVKLPEGKTGFDLFAEDGGKGIVQLVNDAVKTATQPITERFSEAEIADRQRAAMQEARTVFPAVEKHFMPTLNAIDANEQLTAMAKIPGQLGWIMAGVSADLERQAQEARAVTAETKLAEALEVIKKGSFATKIGETGASTRAGATPPTGGTKPKTLKDIAESVYDSVYGGAAN